MFLMLLFQLNSQVNFEYQCSEIDGTPVFLNVTASSEPMDYLGQSFYIYKYDLMIGSARYHSFYTYKFNRRLYLLDEDAKTINYTKDQILFDLNEENRVLEKVSGVFSDVDLQMDDKLKLNNKSFYFYSASAISFSYFNVTRMIFDNSLDINQMEIKSYLGTSQCVLKNIIIEPIEKKLQTSTKKIKKKKSSSSLKDIKFYENWNKK
ncbi:MAG: hypothetical protein JNL75_01415 [Chitinophagales bacterium]|nr:hypothetical protein [Chitinophagales bacterium]